MSWSKPLRSHLLVGSLLACIVGVSGCSFTPVYSDAAMVRSQLHLSFAEPNNRLEQLIYQELALRFGNAGTSDARQASVSVNTRYADAALSQTANPNKPIEVTVTATLTVAAAPGGKALVLTRSATASYTKNDQVLADREAVTAATEQAARAAAESLRLGLLASLSR